MKFWDTSAILPLCVAEPRTTLVKPLAVRDRALVAWWATPVECCSALARLRRERLLTSGNERAARDVLQHLTVAWTEITPSEVVRDRARQLLLLHPLRAGAALQLAAALVWAAGRSSGHEFVCLDERLRDAAHREGFLVLPISF